MAKSSPSHQTVKTFNILIAIFTMGQNTKDTLLINGTKRYTYSVLQSLYTPVLISTD